MRRRTTSPARPRRRRPPPSAARTATSSVIAEARDVGHHVVRARGRLDLEARVSRSGRSQVPPLAVLVGRRRGSTRSGSESATSPATCSGAGAATVRKSWTDRIPRESGAGATTHPTRHPVTAYVFDSALIVTVRSSSPATDRDRHVHGAVVQDVLVDLVGERDHAPLLAERRDHVELLAGEHLARRVVRRVDRRSPRVRSLNAAASSSSSNVQSGACSVTVRGTAPEMIESGP